MSAARKDLSVRAAPRLATIGVYGATGGRFVEALLRERIALLVDIRQRRGVRGRDYAWANAKRLQAMISEAGIAYEHHLELAPTTEMRELQYREDARLGVGKRSRKLLSERYAERYREEILASVEVEDLAALVRRAGAVAPMCVEREPASCHRSLAAAWLGDALGVRPLHLRP